MTKSWLDTKEEFRHPWVKPNETEMQIANETERGLITPRVNQAISNHTKQFLERMMSHLQRLTDKWLFAWKNSDRSQVPLDPKLVQMLWLKENYLLDPKATKSDLVRQPNCPNFPEGLWTNVLLM